MSSTTKIAVYSLSDLKNTTDDALPNYLNSIRFKQSHYHTDVRLAIGYAAAIIGAATFYFDWKLGFEKTKFWTAWAVAAYCLLNGAFSYWIFFVEKGVIYNGDLNGRQLTITSRTERLYPTYFVTARFNAAPSGGKPRWKEVEISAPFARWFTADGFFVAKPFQQWLASEVPLVGEADPAAVVEEIGRGSESSDSFQAQDAQPVTVEELAGAGPAKKRTGSSRLRQKQ